MLMWVLCPFLNLGVLFCFCFVCLLAFALVSVFFFWLVEPCCVFWSLALQTHSLSNVPSCACDLCLCSLMFAHVLPRLQCSLSHLSHFSLDYGLVKQFVSNAGSDFIFLCCETRVQLHASMCGCPLFCTSFPHQVFWCQCTTPVDHIYMVYFWILWFTPLLCTPDFLP